jgi:tetratricopeptide (TPR) repeat protein
MLSPDGLEVQPSASPLLARLLRCPLPPERKSSIADAIARREYHKAETDLLAAINENPSSTDLLVVAAGVFFLDRDFLNSAIALKKADHIRPLLPPDRLTLCLAYIALHRGEWARTELEKLVRDNPQDAAFEYWLARIDYDERRYGDAITRFKKSVELDPKFVKGYDNLGLSLEADGDLDAALLAYSRAGELNRQSSSPSPWPPLNLGALLLRSGREKEAGPPLLEALKYDPANSQAHFRLGLVCEKQGHPEQAIAELRKAAELDPAFPDAFFAMGRIYRRLGNDVKAEEAFNAFRKLKNTANQQLTPSRRSE